MCGICGFNWEDKALVRDCARTIEHRGPDGEGFYTDKHLSLGHRRLSIIDLSERARQPMSNEDGTVWIIFNGEIYNYKELRQGLEKSGHTFASDSDTEVIIHSYEQHGPDCVKMFRGMFAFCIWDSRKRILLLARDPIGKKPLYYFWDGKRLIFASEIKAILAAGVKKEVDEQGLLAFMGFNYVPGSRTFFKGISKLLPGHTLTLKDGKVSISQYWDIKEDILNRDEAYFAQELGRVLEESIRVRMLASDVPIGAFLSGGLDSSSMVALAKKHVGYQMHTFSIGFETFSELPYARTVAERLETSHHEIELKEKDVISALQKIAWHFDEPVGDPAVIPNYFLSREARKHVKVVLAGEGGDELFGGYPHYKSSLKAYGSRIPGVARRSVGSLLHALPESPTGGRKRRLLRFYSQTGLDEIHYSSTRFLSDNEISRITNTKARGLNGMVVGQAVLANPLNRLLYLDCKNMLPEKYLMKGDKATMANSVEERLPLLDKNLIEFAFRINPDLKIRNGNEKYVLREVMRKSLPAITVQRGKQGFGTPIVQWMSGEIGEMARQMIGESDTIRHHFQPGRISRLAGTRSMNYRNSLLLWLLFSIAMWDKQFND
jgi:asparagine synthase (glutamine-hydrolysing)